MEKDLACAEATFVVDEIATVHRHRPPTSLDAILPTR